MDSRPRIVNTETGQFYPISTFEDLKETLRLMGMASSTIRPYIANWYNKVFLPRFEALEDNPNELRSKNGYLVASEIHVGLNTTQLAEATKNLLHVTKPNSDLILKSYLYPLLNLGYIDKIQSNIDKRAYIYFPIKEGYISSTFDSEKDLRLKITDHLLFPSKNVIEHEMRTINLYYDREGVEKNKKYLLIDPDGNEITVNELVDKYLSNPELCFKKDYQEPTSHSVLSNLIYVETIQKNIISHYPLS